MTQSDGSTNSAPQDVKAKMREALERKKGASHPDDSVSGDGKAHGSEVVGSAAPQMHRRKAGGGGV